MAVWDISGDEIRTWSQRVDAFHRLPDLVRRLLLATTPLGTIDMRADGGAWLSGWDGIVHAHRGTAFCPPGASVWELTTRTATRSKLDDDYEKRKKEAPGSIVPREVAYVVVTAQRFEDKAAWAAERAKPPGRESPLLVDPALECGVDHIEFKLSEKEKKWRPIARNGSEKGDRTIAVCRLDREDLLEVYTAHVEKNVKPEVGTIREALGAGDKRALHQALWRADQRLLRPNQPYVGLAYDALVHHIPNDQLAPFRMQWFRPS